MSAQVVWESVFWVAAGLVLHAYIFYPMMMAAGARLFGRTIHRGGHGPRSVSIVVSAYNEEERIDQRVDELLGWLESTTIEGEVIVVSDGSTDDTAAVARQRRGPRLRVIEREENRGKAASISEGCAAARFEVIAFADARQEWAPDAIERLLENFEDPMVGAVGGDLVLESEPGVMAGVGLYWRFEKWLRRQESRVHSTVGLTGAIGAIRRELFRPIPPGTILDDMYWPLRVAMQGYRVVHDGRARAFDRLPDQPSDEFRRKVRTLSGNFQLVMRLPSAIAPWRNPIWFQFVSHKLLRLVVPWALLAVFAASAALPGTFYRLALMAQLTGYTVALFALTTPIGARVRLVSAAGSFLVLNAAAWFSFWIWISGGASRSWSKVRYAPEPRGLSAQTPHDDDVPRPRPLADPLPCGDRSASSETAGRADSSPALHR